MRYTDVYLLLYTFSTVLTIDLKAFTVFTQFPNNVLLRCDGIPNATVPCFDYLARLTIV